MAHQDEVSGSPGVVARVGKFLERIGTPAPVMPAAIPKRLPAVRAEQKMTSGVTFVGAPDTSRMIYLSGQITPDVERLNTATAALSSAYAFAAIDWRARRFAEAPLWVARQTAKGIEWDRSHPLSRVFAYPREDMSIAELLDLTLRYRDSTGRAVWIAERNSTGEIVQFAPFSGAEVRTKKGDGLIFGSYEILIGGTWRPVDRRDVVDFRELFGSSWHDLTSRLEVALSMVNLGHSVHRMLRSFMLKAMFPGGVISSDPKWDPTDPDWDGFKNAIAQWYQGPANAGVPLTLKGGATFNRVNSGLSDLVPDEVLDRVEATIGSTFGVPPIVLGYLVGLRNSPWSQAEQMERQAYSGTVLPIWVAAGDTLTRALLTREEIESGLSIRFDSSAVRALQEDDERRARISTLNAGIWTVDERREFTGKDPLGDDRGETIAGLVTFGPLEDPNADPDSGGEPAADAGAPAAGEDATAAAENGQVAGTALNGAQVAALVTIVQSVTEGLLPLESARAIVSASFPLLTPEQVDAIFVDVVEGSNPPAPAPDFGGGDEDAEEEEPVDDEEADAEKRRRRGAIARKIRAAVASPKRRTKSVWLDFDVGTKANEPAWAATILAELQVQRAATVKLAHATLKAGKSIDQSSADQFQLRFDKLMKQAQPRMRAIAEPLVLATGTQAVRTLSARIGVGFDLLQPGLLSYAEREAAFLAQVMGETTGTLVSKAVEAGLRDGDTIARMIDRLSQLPAFGPDRAGLVARTETTRAWNGAQRASASRFEKESGRVVVKTWLSSQDARVREEHAILNGEQRGIDEAFSNGLQAPGEPNCRCTLTYAVARPI